MLYGSYQYLAPHLCGFHMSRLSMPGLTTASNLIRNLISSDISGDSEASGSLEAVPEVFVKLATPFPKFINVFLTFTRVSRLYYSSIRLDSTDSSFHLQPTAHPTEPLSTIHSTYAHPIPPPIVNLSLVPLHGHPVPFVRCA